MNGDEYRKATERLDLTLVEAARFLGVDDTTSRRWVSDKSPVPRPVVILLRLMIRYRLSADHVMSLVAKKIRT